VRLTKLELNGFKSFADQTELSFDSGVTAVVGPNGCGKSNISDAVRWVLGEQRARALRGAKMEEVIFQGSSARRAVNIAEVSLHFANEGDLVDVPFREVVITRRLSRSGESEYLLNRAPCRLRDVHDLLQGTGLGAESGVVIEAKMIDALLSDRPDDRRELFEEAAGVGLYRDRRRTTERRLEETTLDLGRLDDLLSEVQSQVRSLARQRKRTERHAELAARRFKVEVALAAREMAAWRDELAQLEHRLEVLRRQSPSVHAAVTDAEAARDRAYGVRAAAEGRRSELAKLVGDERQAMHELRAEIAVAEERQRNALSRRERAEVERREGGESAARLATDRDKAVADRSSLEERLRAASIVLQNSVTYEDQARTAVTVARAAVDAAESQLREASEAIHRVTLDRESAAQQLAELEERQPAVTADEATARASANEVSIELDLAAKRLAAEQQRLEESSAAAAAAYATRDAARDREVAAREELHRLEQERAGVEARLAALEMLEHERVGVAPAAARLLDEREAFGANAILGPLSDFIGADARAAGIVERYLGPLLHAVIVRDRQAADAVRAWHRRTQPGALVLLPLDAIPNISTTEDGNVLQLVQPAPQAGEWVRTLLADVRASEEGAAFTDPRGAVWLPGAVAGPGPLRRKAELIELRSRLGLLAQDTDRRAAIVDELHAATAAAAAAAVAASQALTDQTRVVRQLDDHRSELARRRQRALRDLDDAIAARERLEQRHAEMVQRMTAAATHLVELERDVSKRQRELSATREAVAQATRHHEDTRDARTNAQVQKAQIDAHLQVALDRERHLATEYTTAAGKLTTLLSELSTLADADTRLAEQLEDWKADLTAREGTLHDAEERLAASELAVKAADEALIAAEKGRTDTRQHATEVHDELHSAEVRYTELSGRRAAIRERLEAEWRRPVEELLSAAEPLDHDDDALREEAHSLREQLDALGPVNALAIEEHDEEVKRLEFLTGQRDDLASAKHSLEKAVREIDATAQELFLAAFAQIRENFRHIFLTLFGGGECDLRLELPDAPLEGDIEIHASPRGKRTQRIHMLSTGERALVALSLLFGIFLTKPSPFCVLDEVDAPLDDVNIGRFVRMLNQFKSRTQFIVITHNPRTTTEAADAVFGVTMQEPGVSSLVSVRLRGARAVDESSISQHEQEVPLAVSA
jgi:chromosome segregation protein